MTELVLKEYSTTAGIPLSGREIGFIREALPSVVVTPSGTANGRFDLTPGSVVGVVETAGLRIEVRPKLPVDRVLFLLSWALGTGRFLDDPTGFAKAESLVEALVILYGAAVERATRRGLLMRYRTEEASLATVRGRIRFDSQIRERFGLLPPVEVRFDEFTVDIDANRILKAALVRLGRIALRSPASREVLHRLAPRFGEVSNAEYPQGRVPGVGFDRLNSHYRPAVDLARFILADCSPEFGGQSVDAHGLLVDMNRLFEAFVIAALRDRLSVGARELQQGARGRLLTLDHGGTVPLEPDISWWQGSRCVFVGDLKYKSTTGGKVPNADLYQLLAYMTATGLDTGLLVYADGEPVPVSRLVKHTGKELVTVGLDLAGEPASVMAEIDRLANLVREMASSGMKRPRPISGVDVHPVAV